jgi:hypothetical protein
MISDRSADRETGIGIRASLIDGDFGQPNRIQSSDRLLRGGQPALRYVHPRLSASADLIGDDFASKLERAVKRSEKGLELEATKIDEEREGS